MTQFLTIMQTRVTQSNDYCFDSRESSTNREFTLSYCEVIRSSYDLGALDAAMINVLGSRRRFVDEIALHLRVCVAADRTRSFTGSSGED